MTIRFSFLFAVAMFTGCTNITITEQRCAGDVDCDLGFYCDPDLVRCVYDCRGDVDCAPGDTCTTRGRCIERIEHEVPPPAETPMIYAELDSGGIVNGSIVSGGTVGLLTIVSSHDAFLHRLRLRFFGATEASPLVGSLGTHYIADITAEDLSFSPVMGPVDLPALAPLSTDSGEIVLEGNVFIPANVEFQIMINVHHPAFGMEDAPGEFSTGVHYYSLVVGEHGWFVEGDIELADTGEYMSLNSAFPDHALSAYWTRDPNLH